MANTKLLKVMDYLINEQEDKARELLHQIFIEKARAIHEQMTSHDEDMEEDRMGHKGGMGGSLAHEIQDDLNEIDAEEHYGTSTMEAEDDDMDMEDAEEDLSDELEDADDMDDMEDVEDADDMEGMEDEGMEGEEELEVDVDDEDESEKIHDLEQAIAELKAEFEALKHESEGGEHEEEHEDKMAEAWEDNTNDLREAVKDVGSYQGIAKWKHTNGNTVTMEDGEWQAHDNKGRVYATGTYEDEDDGTVFYTDSKTADATGVDEISAGMPVSDYAQAAEEILGSLYSSYTKHKGMMENVDLETVHAAKGGEVGSGKFAPAETNKHSPVPSSQSDMMGARPVKTGQGTKASGYDRQSAPDSKSLGLSNRRKDAEDGKHPVSKEGDASALLNKGTSAGYGAVNTRSPISGRK